MPYLPEGIYADIRRLNMFREQLTEDRTRTINRLHREKIYFPEYMDAFGKIEGSFTLEVLKRAPFPEDILALGAAGLRSIWHEAKLRGRGYSRADAIVRLAEQSVGLRYGTEASREAVKWLVKVFYQNKDRMQKQIAISIMQFDTLNEVYGSNRGAGRLIEKVYEELQEILNMDPHYWLQRSKCIYRRYPTDKEKLKEAYQYCVKAKDAENLPEKLDAQTSLSLSLISGLLNMSGADPDLYYAEKCITHGYNAMISSYYSWNDRKRLEKERVGTHQSYEALCSKVCHEYLSNQQADNADCKSMAFKICEIIKRWKRLDA